LGTAPKFVFSWQFSGAIWNTIVVPNRDVLIVETRDDKNFKTKFSALDFKNNKFMWKDLELKESWWIGLTAANENILLFHTFVDRGNPDKKNLIAFDIFNQKVCWEIESFSFFDWNDTEIFGYTTKDEIKKTVAEVKSGVLTEANWEANPKVEPVERNSPQFYLEGSPHFEPVKKFMELKANVHLKGGVEYLEYQDWIIISAYLDESGLANYLYVFDKTGQIVLLEKLGEKLQGLGVDTFFILAGCLFLVKNKSELVAFRVYD
jgi:hypothetical protein